MPEKKTLWNLVKEKDTRDVQIKGILLDIKLCLPGIAVAIMDDGTSGCQLVIATKNCLEEFFGMPVDKAYVYDPDDLKNEVTEKRIAATVIVSGDAIFDGEMLVFFVREIEFPYREGRRCKT